MKLDCQKIHDEIGLYCHRLDEKTLLVSTPLCFADNSVINFYIETDGKCNVITDDGNTLIRFHSIGLGGNSRLASSLNNRASHHDGKLIDGRLVFMSNSIREAYTNFIKTMIELINFELEHAAVSENHASLINRVINELERRNPGCHIQHDVSLAGYSGRVYPFPIKADDRVIAITTPNHQATGSMLRRVADIEKAGNQSPLVIVDDTVDAVRGRLEASLLATLVPCMLLRDLMSEDSPVTLKLH